MTTHQGEDIRRIPAKETFLTLRIPLRTPLILALAAGGWSASPGAARAQAVLEGRVLDEMVGTPVAEAEVVLRSAAPDVAVAGAGLPRRLVTGPAGDYRFGDLPPGRYRLTVERYGYRRMTVDLTLAGTEPLAVTLLLEPGAFPVGPVALRGTRSEGPQLVPPPPPGGATAGEGRPRAVRARQERYLSGDTRRLSLADVREANTLAEDDVFRALQAAPGVARRDDYAADLWTRGAAAGHTVVTFDGVPVLGPFHVLGMMGGFTSDMLASATFQPGVSSAASQGGGAATLELESRSPATAPRLAAAGLSPVSARFTADGQPSDRLAWAVGVRRSHLDLLSTLAELMSLGGHAVDYAFADLTGRVDVRIGDGARLEASTFLQDDRVFGDVGDLARGSEGDWGTRVARLTLVTPVGGAVVRQTVGVSAFDAEIAASGVGATLHPETDNRFATLMWEGWVEGGTDPGRWSLGATVRRETHRYDGPAIDLARLLTPEELADFGVPDLSPILLGMDRGRTVQDGSATRLAAWGERRLRVAPGLDVEGGLRIEAGDPVRGDPARLAPRLLARWRATDALTLSAGLGRAWQYTQSVARTDVLRPGLRVSELLVQADEDAPALRSDLATLGAEAWAAPSLLLGATAWVRATGGLQVPNPSPGPLNGPRAVVEGRGSARGIDVSARRLDGPVRGFLTYSLSESLHRVGSLEFAASEDRRHVANLSVMGDVTRAWTVGGTVRAESGAPFTRVTLVSTACAPSDEDCDESPVLLGTAGGQRSPPFASLDLMTEWSRAFDGWSLSVYAQLRNALGRTNAVTYHSSCVCVPGAGGGDAWMGDEFERGLPRLPLIGLRARF